MRNMAAIRLMMGAMLVMQAHASGLKADEPAAAFEAFAEFCRASFGAEREPLVYERFGDTLRVIEDSRWSHVSRTSACLAWTTSLPATTVVEYGPTPALGSTTPPADRPFYNHVHYLRDLRPNTTYHYRLVSTDERGNVTRSEPATFRTVPLAQATLIDSVGAIDGYRITKPGYYLVTADLVAERTALIIDSNDVTLDLGGRVITYDESPGPAIEGEDPNVWFEKSPHGVLIARRNLQNVRVINGTIVQGRGGSGAQANGRGANPIGAMSGVGAEVAGVTIRWHGAQVHGFCMLWNPPVEVHHCVAEDYGSGITNRHQGVTAMHGVAKAHHNRITRTRHRGIDAVDGGDIHANEIYVDSVATNASGVMAYKTRNLAIRDNRIFGGGYLAVGISTVSQGLTNVTVSDNLVHMQAAAPSAAWTEYGEQSGAYCFRVTWGGEAITCENNLFISYGRDGGMVRGIWYCPDPQQRGNVIRNNIIKVISENDASDIRGAIVISGSEDPTGVEPVLIERNRVISNFCHVLLGEPYGSGHSTRFVGNTFERVGDLDRYRFVQIGHGDQVCTNNRFVDSVFGEGVRPDAIRWEGREDAPRSFDIGWTLTVETRPGAGVTVRNQAGEEVASGVADSGGRFTADVLQWTFANGGATQHAPHEVTVTHAGRTTAQSTTVDRPTTLTLKP
jgi:hypothetical protein